MPKVDVVIFDLDGTLIDSAPSIQTSLRQAIQCCIPEWNEDIPLGIIGPPIIEIVNNLLPSIPSELQAAIIAAYRHFYDTKGVLVSKPYRGAVDLLRWLKLKGVRRFIATNKPQVPTSRILKHLGIDELFDGAESPDSVVPARTSKSETLAAMIEQYKIIPANSLFVGDSLDDAHAAAVCNVPFVAAKFGYGCAAIQTQYPVSKIINNISHLNFLL